MKINFDTKKLTKKLGLDPNGRVQAILDSSVISHLRENMPKESGMMITNTRRERPGLIVVATPYANYMNEGIKYIDPIYKVGAFPIRGGKISFDKSKGSIEGFVSRKGIKKIPSGEKLNYHGGANRGSHFVERTLNENFNDILKDVKEGVKNDR